MTSSSCVFLSLALPWLVCIFHAMFLTIANCNMVCIFYTKTGENDNFGDNFEYVIMYVWVYTRAPPSVHPPPYVRVYTRAPPSVHPPPSVFPSLCGWGFSHLPISGRWTEFLPCRHYVVAALCFCLAALPGCMREVLLGELVTLYEPWSTCIFFIKINIFRSEFLTSFVLLNMLVV